MNIRNISSKPLSDIVYDKLKNEILTLEIKPGNILTENDISKKYDISRSTVRSVFQKLKDDKLITAIPYKLSYVSQLDINTILDVIYMRIGIESMIMRDFIELDDKKSIRALERNIEDQEDLLSGKDYQEFAKLDREFHEIMYNSMGKTGVWNFIQKAELSYVRFKTLDLMAFGDIKDMYNNHKKLLEIIQNKKIGQIEDAYKRHLYSGINRMKEKVLVDYKNYFTEGTPEESLERIETLLKHVYEK